MIDFEFDTVGLRRIEAPVAVGNGNGNSAAEKLGNPRERLLRASVLGNGDHLDQHLRTIPTEVRHRAKVIWGGTEPLQ